MANKTYNDVQANVKFTKAATRTDLNIVTTENPTGETNENIVLTLGKISKWYEALIPTGGSTGQILMWNTDGTAKWADSSTIDTKNTAGATDTSSKIYLIGATAQTANPQTYSDNEVFATSGVLTTKKVQVGGGACTMEYNSTTESLDFVFT